MDTRTPAASQHVGQHAGQHVGQHPRVPRPPLATRVVAWGLLVVCAVLAVTLLTFGERQGQYEDLRSAVRAGAVHDVRVTGGTSQPFRGTQQVEVHWRSGLSRHVATVLEVRPRAAAERQRVRRVMPVVTSVADDLRAIDADVEVTREQWTPPTQLLGRRVPGWVPKAVALLAVGTFLLIVAGPQPWRATRWAWFWFLLLASPVGLVAFLVLGGSAGVLAPADPSRRMRGGWAFLLALVVGAASSAVARAVGV